MQVYINGQNYSSYEDVPLNELHTKQLLKLLKLFRYNQCECCYRTTHNQDRYIFSNLIRAVLSTREHIPNKKEARKIRQNRAN
jgi:hypothetical protein